MESQRSVTLTMESGRVSWSVLCHLCETLPNFGLAINQTAVGDISISYWTLPRFSLPPENPCYPLFFLLLFFFATQEPANIAEERGKSLVLSLAGILGILEDNKEFQVPSARRSNNPSMKQLPETWVNNSSVLNWARHLGDDPKALGSLPKRNRRISHEKDWIIWTSGGSEIRSI